MQGILQAPKLGVRIAAKGLNRALGQKQVRIVNQLLPERVQVQIMLRIQTEQLYGIGIAAQEQRNHFHKAVDGRVGLRVHILFKMGQPDKVGFPVQGHAPDINVTFFVVRSVGIASRKPQQNHMPAQVLVGLDEAVCFGF